MDRLIQGARSLFIGTRREHLPISREILTKITRHSTSVDDININSAFKLAFAGFLRMGEFTHTKAMESSISLFVATN